MYFTAQCVAAPPRPSSRGIYPHFPLDTPLAAFVSLIIAY